MFREGPDCRTARALRRLRRRIDGRGYIWGTGRRQLRDGRRRLQRRGAGLGHAHRRAVVDGHQGRVHARLLQQAARRHGGLEEAVLEALGLLDVVADAAAGRRGGAGVEAGVERGLELLLDVVAVEDLAALQVEVLGRHELDRARAQGGAPRRGRRAG